MASYYPRGRISVEVLQMAEMRDGKVAVDVERPG